MEDYEHGSNDLRSQGGPLKVSKATDEGPLYDALRAAATELGIPDNPDYNGVSQEGIVRTQTTISNGVRMSTARCYLKPIKNRKNLRVETGAHTQKVIMEGKKCVGIDYHCKGKTIRAKSFQRSHHMHRRCRLPSTLRTVRDRSA